MSIQSFTQYARDAVADPAEANALREALASRDALMAYAAAKGYSLDPAEAEEIMAGVRRVPDAGGLEALPDASLDRVSGGGYLTGGWWF